MNFLIRRRAEGRRRLSMVVPFSGVAGLAVARDTTDATKAAKAGATNVAGLLIRDVVSGGPSVLQRAQVWPGEGHLPDAMDGECSIEPLPDAYEIEGADLIVQSGTGAIDADTALGTAVGYNDGRARVAQTGDRKVYRITDKPTPETAGNVRILLEKIEGADLA